MIKIIYIQEAILCIKSNRLRSFLALLGLLIGTSSVVALITIGFLAKNTILEQFKNLGTQKILVHINTQNTHEISKLYQSIQYNLFDKDIISDYHVINGSYKNANYQGIKLQSFQLGIINSLNKSLKLSARLGRLISDQDRMRYFAVIGSDIQKQIIEEQNKLNPAGIQKTSVNIGETIEVDHHILTIIGILSHRPTDPLFNYDINRSILIPLGLSQYINNNTMTEIYFDLNKNIQPKIAENYLKKLLSNMLPNTELQFSNAEQILEQLNNQAKILTILLGTIGAISLIVGAIGVMNIMIVSIVERKGEIGIRMAIGATPAEIKLQFLYETICLASIGGFLGTMIGILIPLVITYFAGWSFAIPLYAIIFGLFISLVVGVISGFYPATKASRMLPVECLMHSY